jgi:hypothetical protein
MTPSRNSPLRGLLFYTTDNAAHRDLRLLDPATGRTELLQKDALPARAARATEPGRSPRRGSSGRAGIAGRPEGEVLEVKAQ